MSCKYLRTGLLSDYCTARRNEEKIAFPHLREYCQSSSKFEKCNTYKEVSTGCFITTACVTALGCSDDCRELTAMRSFRDGWLKHQLSGEAEIQKYYKIAPQIVCAINKNPDSDKIFRRIYTDFILPCVSFIEWGNNKPAYRLYTLMVATLSEEYLS